MASQIKFKPSARNNLRALGFPRDREIVEYLNREIAPRPDPRSTGYKYY
jgi:hypothetical protein